MNTCFKLWNTVAFQNAHHNRPVKSPWPPIMCTKTDQANGDRETTLNFHNVHHQNSNCGNLWLTVAFCDTSTPQQQLLKGGWEHVVVVYPSWTLLGSPAECKHTLTYMHSQGQRIACVTVSSYPTTWAATQHLQSSISGGRMLLRMELTMAEDNLT